MAVNLVRMVLDPLDGDAVEAIGRFVGTDHARTRSALACGVATLIAGLMQKTSSTAGASELSASLGSFDARFLDDLARALGSEDAERMVSGGGRMVASLFGDRLPAVTAALARATNLRGDGASALLGVLAPIATAVLARHVDRQGLDAAGLANLMASQRSVLSGILPSTLSTALGLRGPSGASAEADGLGQPGGAPPAAPARAGEPGGSWLRRLAPVVAVAALAWLGFENFTSSPRSPRPGGLPAVSAAAPARSLDLGAALHEASLALGRVRDESSAREALPAIADATVTMGEVLARRDRLSATQRAVVRRQVREFEPLLQELMDAQPSPTAGVLQPSMNELMRRLAAFDAG